MPTTDQVVVEFVADTSQLTPGVDQLSQLGDIDAGTAAIFTKTNAALQDRAAVIASTVKSTDQLSASVSAQQAIYNKLVVSVQNLSGASKQAVQNLLTLSAGDIARGFQETGVTVDQYVAALENASGATNSLSDNTTQLRTQIFQITNQLAEMTIAGQANTEQFDALSVKAGQLKQALQQSQQAVKNFATENPTINAFATGVNSLAGAFQVAAGASALLGGKDQDLQAALTKVIAVTSIAQGLQQALNITKLKGAVTTLQVAAATQIENASIILNNALQSESIVVTTAATVAQYAFNLALSLNPLGLFAVVLAGAIVAFNSYSQAAAQAAIDQANFTAAVEDTQTLLDLNLATTKRNTSEQLSALDDLGAQESTKLKAQAAEKLKIAQGYQQAISNLNEEIFVLEGKTDEESVKNLTTATAAKEKLVSQLKDANVDYYNTVRSLDKQSTIEQLQAQNDLANAKLALQVKNSDAFFAAERVAAATEAAVQIKNAGQDAEKVANIRAQLAKQTQDINTAQAEADQVRTLASLTDNLLQQQIISKRINSDTTDAETQAQIDSIKEVAAFQIKQGQKTGELNLAQQKEIALKAQAQIEQLQRDQAQRDITLANQNAIALNNAVLSDVKATNKERLDLENQNVLDQVAIDVKAQNLTEQKREAIIAAGNEKILKNTNAFLQQQAELELDTNENTQAQINADIEKALSAQSTIRSANNPKQTAQILGVPILNLDQQKDAIDQLTQFQLSQNGILIQSNADRFAKGLISEEDFSKADQDLTAKSVDIYQKGEDKKRQATLDTVNYQKKLQQQIIQTSLQGVADGLNILSTLYQQQDAAANAAIEKQKQQVQDGLSAGAITARAAAEQTAELDAKSKVLQRQQAQRNKELAIFQAIIGTATAVVSALDAPPPLSFISAAIAGALGAAQIAVIAAQPLPQFNKGKKDAYEGFGEIAERGRAEIFEHNGQMFVADKPSIVWVGARDKIYNPDETARMLSGPSINTMAPLANFQDRTKEINYDKIGKAVAANIPNLSLNIDGYKEFIRSKESFTTRLNARRKWR